jgi:hypothetical protein
MLPPTSGDGGAGGGGTLGTVGRVNIYIKENDLPLLLFAP